MIEDCEGTNEPFPFGNPSDVEFYAGRIRVSRDPRVIERLKNSARPFASAPKGKQQDGSPVVYAKTRWTADEEAQIRAAENRLGSNLLAALNLLVEYGLLAHRPARALAASGLIEPFELDVPINFLSKGPC